MEKIFIAICVGVGFLGYLSLLSKIKKLSNKIDIALLMNKISNEMKDLNVQIGGLETEFKGGGSAPPKPPPKPTED